MSMTTADAPPLPAKSSRLPLILGIVLGIAGAGGGFAATRMGLFSGGGEAPAAEEAHAATDDHAAPAEEAPAADDSHAAADEHAEPAADAATDDGHGAASATGNFVALDPLIVNIQDQAGGRFLRFVAEIEAEPGHAAEVEAIRPRFADVLNGYLRAVDMADLQNPQGLDLLRGQMLRRLQTVAGEGVIRDLLITEFVLN
jgi:flagellar FliL protein